MRRRLPDTLRGRLAGAAALAAGVVLVVVGVVLLALYERSEHRALDDQLVEQAERVERPAAAALALGLDRAIARINPKLVRQVLGGGDSLRVLDGRRVIVAAGDPRGDALPPPTREGFAQSSASGEDWRTYTRDLGAGRRLTLAAPLEPTRTRIRRARKIVLLAVVGGIGGVSALAWWLAGLALAPLTELRGGATRVSGTRDLRERLPVAGDGPEEVRALAGSLNAMLSRLEGSAERTEAALRAARTFTADAGHELRTPLTALRANVDTLVRNPGLADDERARLLDDIEADQRRMAALLDGLQALARGDAGVPGTRAPVDLGELASSAIGAARRRHPQTTWELDAAPVIVEGVADGLRMLLDNLLENAARHGRRGGTVRVTVGGDAIVVDDNGPGIAPAERERVFARFARGPATRVNGSGLGLAIVAQQAALHGGSARAEESPLGGTRIVVELRRR